MNDTYEIIIEDLKNGEGYVLNPESNALQVNPNHMKATKYLTMFIVNPDTPKSEYEIKTNIANMGIFTDGLWRILFIWRDMVRFLIKDLNAQQLEILIRKTHDEFITALKGKQEIECTYDDIAAAFSKTKLYNAICICDEKLWKRFFQECDKGYAEIKGADKEGKEISFKLVLDPASVVGKVLKDIVPDVLSEPLKEKYERFKDYNKYMANLKDIATRQTTDIQVIVETFELGISHYCCNDKSKEEMRINITFTFLQNVWVYKDSMGDEYRNEHELDLLVCQFVEEVSILNGKNNQLPRNFPVTFFASLNIISNAKDANEKLEKNEVPNETQKLALSYVDKIFQNGEWKFVNSLTGKQIDDTYFKDPKIIALCNDPPRNRLYKIIGVAVNYVLAAVCFAIPSVRGAIFNGLSSIVDKLNWNAKEAPSVGRE